MREVMREGGHGAGERTAHEADDEGGYDGEQVQLHGAVHEEQDRGLVLESAEVVLVGEACGAERRAEQRAHRACNRSEASWLGRKEGSLREGRLMQDDDAALLVRLEA